MVCGRQDFVFAVAVSAAGRHGIAARCRLPVEASVLFTRRGFVAGAAIDKLQIFGMPPSPGAGQVRVTFHARQSEVNGRCAGIFGHEDGYTLTPAGTLDVRPGVTLKALLVFLGWCGVCHQQEEGGDCEEPTLPMTTLKQSGAG